MIEGNPIMFKGSVLDHVASPTINEGGKSAPFFFFYKEKSTPQAERARS